MKLSMMSYTMARRKDLFDIPAMLALTRELDMAGVDFVTLYGHDAKDLRKMADDHGVPVVCHTFHAALNEPAPEERAKGLDQARQGIDDAVALGAPVVMIIPKGRPGEDRATGRRHWIAGLKEAAPIAADAGVTLTLENFTGTEAPFVIADDLLQMVRDVPGAKITYDNGNAATGEDPAESFTRCAEHIAHAHFKDWDVRDQATDRYRPMLDGRFYRPALIGEGSMDQAACLQAMKAAGYQGCINIEYEGNEYTPADAVRRAVDTLREVWAGLD